MGFKDTEWAYTVQGLKPMQTAVLAAICHRTDDATHKTVVGQQTVADMIGCDRVTVLRTLGALEQHGLISRTKRNRRDGSKTSDTIAVLTESNVAQSNVSQSNVANSHVAESPNLRDSLQQQREAKASPVNQRVNQKRGAANRGTRIPDPFIVTTDMRLWASTECPAVDVDLATRTFVDHWRAATRNATKLDWIATWRNWLRRDQQHTRPAASRKQTPEDRMRATLALVPELPQKEIS